MAPSSKRTYAIRCMAQFCSTQSPYPCGRPLLTPASAGDTQTLTGRSGSESVGPLGLGAHKALSEPSEHLWCIWGLILHVISPLLPSCWGFLFALGRGVYIFGGVQHSLSVVAQQLAANSEFSEDKMKIILINTFTFDMVIIFPLFTL